MLKSIRILVGLCCLTAIAMAQSPAKWTITEGIVTPESAYVDPTSGFLFISSVVGQPNEKDGKGHIVKAMMATRIYALKDGKVSTFADGPDLEWPNGLLVDGNRLIVAA